MIVFYLLLKINAKCCIPTHTMPLKDKVKIYITIDLFYSLALSLVMEFFIKFDIKV